MLLLLCAGVGTVKGLKGQALEVSAAALVEAYKGNEVAADEKYKGKVLQITGRVRTVSSGVRGKMYLVLGTGEQFEILGVQCSFEDKHKEELGKLVKGESVTIHGRGAGKMLNVLVNQCELVKK